MRRLDRLVTIASQMVRSKGVDGNENDIGSGLGAMLLRRSVARHAERSKAWKNREAQGSRRGAHRGYRRYPGVKGSGRRLDGVGFDDYPRPLTLQC